MWVVVAHDLGGYVRSGMYLEVSNVFLFIIDLAYFFHMPLFMMISGYVFGLSHFDDGKFKLNKVLDHVINNSLIYAEFCIYFVLLRVIFSGVVNEETKLSELFFIWGRPIDVYWYLYALNVLYLLFSLSVVRMANHLLMVGVLTVLCYTSGLFVCEWFQLSNVFHYALFFYIGWLKYMQPVSKNSERVITGTFSLIAVFLFVLSWDHSTHLANAAILSKMAIAIGLSMLFWHFFHEIKCLSENRFLASIGRYSLEIYVLHTIVSAGIRTVFNRAGITNLYLDVGLNLVLSVAIPIGISLLCKRLGFYKVFFRPGSCFRGRKADT